MSGIFSKQKIVKTYATLFQGFRNRYQDLYLLSIFPVEVHYVESGILAPQTRSETDNK